MAPQLQPHGPRSGIVGIYVELIKSRRRALSCPFLTTSRQTIMRVRNERSHSDRA